MSEVLKFGPVDLPLEIGKRDVGDLAEDVHWLWQAHPRIIFTKMLRYGSIVLDFGAGSGVYQQARTDYKPIRADQKMYALDLARGEFFDRYDDTQVADFELTPLKWKDGSIDGVVCSHVVEHLNDLNRFFVECGRVLRPGGKIYIEWPAAYTAGFPFSGDIIPQGFPVISSNFFEDSTHLKPLTQEYVASVARMNDFAVEVAGTIQSDYFGDALLDYARQTNDQIIGMFGLWAKTGWAQYLIVRKADDFSRFVAGIPPNLRRPF